MEKGLGAKGKLSKLQLKLWDERSLDEFVRQNLQMESKEEVDRFVKGIFPLLRGIIITQDNITKRVDLEDDFGEFTFREKMKDGRRLLVKVGIRKDGSDFIIITNSANRIFGEKGDFTVEMYRHKDTYMHEKEEIPPYLATRVNENGEKETFGPSSSSSSDELSTFVGILRQGVKGVLEAIGEN